MLQQTQIKTALPYFHRFVARFPDVNALAAASIDEVLPYWAGLGYYRRVRFLHAAAKEIVAAGGFPTTADGWKALPGIGPYAAGAIVSIAFEQPAPIVDGNVQRVFSRFFGFHDSTGYPLTWKRSAKWVEKAAKEGISPRVFNQAIMELGALICIPSKKNSVPLCKSCPLNKRCVAFKTKQVSAYPKPTERRVSVQVHEVGWMVKRGSRFLFCRDKTALGRGSLWDMPFARIAGDAPVPRHDVQPIGKFKYQVTHHRIERLCYMVKDLQNFLADFPAGRRDRSREWKWMTKEEAQAAGLSASGARACALIAAPTVRARSKLGRSPI